MALSGTNASTNALAHQRESYNDHNSRPPLFEVNFEFPSLVKLEQKMKKVTLLLAASALAGLMGCSKTDNYAPSENATGEDIFYANCTKCHKPETGSVMTLSSATANKEAIIQKLHKGSMSMPAFPNIKGEQAQRLAEFILANSKTK